MRRTQPHGGVIAGRRLIASLSLLTALVDEGFQDRGVLVLFGEDRPGDHVREDAEPVEDREDPEREPDEVNVHPEVASEPGADAGHDPSLPDAQQSLAPAAIVFTHVPDHAQLANALSSGITRLLP